MIRTDWSKVKYFNPSEFDYPEEVDPLLIYSIDRLREMAGTPILINSDYRDGDKGQHGLGKAVDIVIKGWHVVDQYLLAEKSRLFSGIGIYPHWHRQGIHVDIRELQPNQAGARWLRNAAGIYIEISSKTLRAVL